MKPLRIIVICIGSILGIYVVWVLSVAVPDIIKDVTAIEAREAASLKYSLPLSSETMKQSN